MKTNHNGSNGHKRAVPGNGNGATPRDITALLVEHEGFIYTIARHYSMFGVPLEDLLQEGRIGLLQAAVAFDASLGVRFVTYAWWRVRSAIAAAANDAYLIRIRPWITSVRAQVRRETARFQQEHHRDPSIEEIAERLGHPLTTITTAMEPIPQMVSLSALVWDGEEDTPLVDSLADTSTPSLVDALVATQTRARLLDILWCLPRRWREVLLLRFGFTDGIPRSCAEIAKDVGVSKQRVSQIELQALKRLRSLRYREPLQKLCNL